MKARLFMSVKIWLVIYPSITLFLILFGAHLTPLPLYQRTFILTISLVPWMVFIGIPFIDFIVGRFTKKNHPENGDRR
jgi:antibiotic biosynthesis monooxygenase (ABM) superfamily enzyme